jgi:divalent metal cation (Fe/Co/Zn/Cd) transporter
LIEQQPGVERVNELLTMHMGPQDVLVTMSLDFVNTLKAEEVEKTISRLETAIKENHSSVKRVFIEAQSWRSHLESAGESNPATDGDGGPATPTIR